MGIIRTGKTLHVSRVLPGDISLSMGPYMGSKIVSFVHAESLTKTWAAPHAQNVLMVRSAMSKEPFTAPHVLSAPIYHQGFTTKHLQIHLNIVCRVTEAHLRTHQERRCAARVPPANTRMQQIQQRVHIVRWENLLVLPAYLLVAWMLDKGIIRTMGLKNTLVRSVIFQIPLVRLSALPAHQGNITLPTMVVCHVNGVISSLMRVKAFATNVKQGNTLTHLGL